MDPTISTPIASNTSIIGAPQSRSQKSPIANRDILTRIALSALTGLILGGVVLAITGLSLTGLGMAAGVVVLIVTAVTYRIFSKRQQTIAQFGASAGPATIPSPIFIPSDQVSPHAPIPVPLPPPAPVRTSEERALRPRSVPPTSTPRPAAPQEQVFFRYLYEKESGADSRSAQEFFTTVDIRYLNAIDKGGYTVLRRALASIRLNEEFISVLFAHGAEYTQGTRGITSEMIQECLGGQNGDSIYQMLKHSRDNCQELIADLAQVALAPADDSGHIRQGSRMACNIIKTYTDRLAHEILQPAIIISQLTQTTIKNPFAQIIVDYISVINPDTLAAIEARLKDHNPL